jgi:hypothetical protein
MRPKPRTPTDIRTTLPRSMWFAISMENTYKGPTVSMLDLEERENNSRCVLRGSVKIAMHGQSCLVPELLYSFHHRRAEQIILIFAWIHIHQRGIWDMETHKLSRPPSKNFPYIQSIPLPSPSKHPVY